MGRGLKCWEPLPLLRPVRVHPGRPAAHPTATGWDEGILPAGWPRCPQSVHCAHAPWRLHGAERIPGPAPFGPCRARTHPAGRRNRIPPAGEPASRRPEKRGAPKLGPAVWGGGGRARAAGPVRSGPFREAVRRRAWRPPRRRRRGRRRGAGRRRRRRGPRGRAASWTSWRLRGPAGRRA